MHTIEETLLIGNWKSFKIFKRSGEVKLNTEESFREINITPEKQLTIKLYQEHKEKKVVETDQWQVMFKDKRHYLDIMPADLRYEVITVNHTVLVLSDMNSADKIFFTRDCHWKERLQTNRVITL